MFLTLSSRVCDILLKNSEILRGKAPEFGYKGGLTDRVHANLITLVVGIDQLTEADKLWRVAYEMAEKGEDITQPEVVVQDFKPHDCVPNERECKNCSKDCRFKLLVTQIQHLHRMKTKMAVQWLHNSVMLEKYSYDSRRIPKGIRTRELQLHIANDGNNGYSWQGLSGDKLFSLWVRIETDYKYWKIFDLEEIDIPVDIHIAKVPFRTGALTLIQPRWVNLSISQIKPLIRFFWRAAGKQKPLDYDEP